MLRNFVSLSTGPLFCPFCQSRSVSRSRRRGLTDWLLFSPFLLRPFRCRECGKRHMAFLFRKRFPTTSQQAGQR
jgi:hypothetical protein